MPSTYTIIKGLTVYHRILSVWMQNPGIQWTDSTTKFHGFLELEIWQYRRLIWLALHLLGAQPEWLSKEGNWKVEWDSLVEALGVWDMTTIFTLHKLKEDFQL
jgi:hypothetical protein